MTVAPVERVVDEVPAPLVDLALWLADYYGSTPGRALALIAPYKAKPRGERPQPAERQSLAGEDRPAELTAPSSRPRSSASSQRSTGAAAHLLLDGATGSGKTEVYLQAIEAALERGLGAIVLVPEIALAPQTVGRSGAFRRHRRDPPLGRSPRPSAATSASGSRAARRASSSARARPCSRRSSGLGLICVDEEHDAAYKQESDPRYDARTVAAKRAALEGAVAVYGSATPRPESWAHARAPLARRAARRVAAAGPRRRPAPRVGTRCRRRCSRSSARSSETAARRSCS